MSREVDERIVVMDFDNSKFERGTNQCVKDIEKLKKSLNFDSAKSFEELDKAANKVNFSGMHTAFDLLTNKSAWAFGIVINGMNNVINKAEQMATNLIKAFTIDPIAGGYQAYEDKLNSTYTIMAATGDSMDYVSEKLRELNEYSDATIYSFQDMTRNVGKFTNAGISLEDTVQAIKGISNEAALAGAGAAEQSRAMYNISQAMSMGYMQLIDWKSIENANMSILSFKEELADVATEIGTIQKNEDGTFETAEHHFDTLQQLFKDGLQDRWLTNDVMLETFKRFADAETEIGAKAYGAAKDIKSFGQLINVLKEQVKTSWGNSFEIIFGNVEQSVAYFKKISEPLGDLLKTIGDLRNAGLRKIFDNGYSDLTTELGKMNISAESFEETFHNILEESTDPAAVKFKEYMQSVEDEYDSFATFIDQNGLPSDLVNKTLHQLTDSTAASTEAIDSMEDKLEYFQKVVDEVWAGNYSNNWDENNRERERLLTEANYDFVKVQDLVNKTVDGHRLTLEDLNEAQMEAIGFTNEEIQAYKEFNKQIDENNSSVNKMVKAMENASNRFVFMSTLADIAKIIRQSIESISVAWHEVMDDEIGTFFGSIINLAYELIHPLVLDETALRNLIDTFKMVFTVLKWIMHIANMPVKIITSLAKSLGLIDASGILSITGALGRAVTQLDYFLERLDPIGRLIDFVVKKIKDAFTGLIGLKDEFKQFGYWVMAGFENGVNNKYLQVVDFVCGIFERIVKKVHDILQIGSPSKLTFQYGKWFIEGFINGVKSMIKMVYTTIKDVFSEINYITENYTVKDVKKIAVREYKTLAEKLQPVLEPIERGFRLLGKFVDSAMEVTSEVLDKVVAWIKDLDIGTTIAIGLMAGLSYTLYKSTRGIGDLGRGTVAFVKAFADFTGTIGKGLRYFEGFMRAKSFEAYANGIFKLAEALVVVAGAIGIITAYETADLIKAGGIIVAVAAVMALISMQFTKMSTATQALNTAASSGFFLTLGSTFILIAVAMKMITDTVDKSEGKGWIVALGVIFGVFIAITAYAVIMDKFISTMTARSLIGLGVLFIGFASAILIIAGSMAIIGMLKTSTIIKSLAVIGSVMLALAFMVKMSSKIGSFKGIAGLGLMFMGFAFALNSIAISMMLIGMLSTEAIAKSIIVMGVMTLCFAALIAINKTFSNKKIGKWGNGSGGAGSLGLMFIGFAMAMVSIGLAMMIIGRLSEEAIAKSMKVLWEMTGMFIALIAVMAICSKLSGSGGAAKMGLSLLALTVPLVAMAALTVILGMIKEETIAKGIIALTAMTVLIDTMMLCASKVKCSAANSLKAIGIMMLEMTAALVIMSLVPTSKLLGAALAMDMVIIALSIMIKALSSMPSLKTSDVVKFAILTIFMTGLGAVIAVMASTGASAANILASAAAMSLAMLAVTACTVLISNFVKTTDPGKLLSAVAMMGVMLLVFAALAVLFDKIRDIDGANMLKQATALSEVLAVLTGCALIISGIGAIGLRTAVKGIVAFAIFVAALAGLAAGILELASSDWMNEKVTKIGTMIKKFLDNFNGFFESAAKIQNNQIEDCVNLIEAIVKVALASKDMPSNTSGLSKYSKDLPEFAEAVVEMSRVLSQEDYDPDKTKDAIDIMTALAKLENSLPSSGGKIQEWFGTKQTFSGFAEGMKDLGAGFKSFIDETGDIIIDKDKTDTIINAATAIAGLENNLPRSGGLMKTILGDRQTLTQFSEMMPPFGKAMKALGHELEGANIDEGIITSAANSAKAINELNSKLPRTGGVLQEWLGDRQTLYNFSDQLPYFGTAMKKFSDALGTDFNADAVKSAGDAAQGLAALEKNLPTHGGKLETWLGKKESLTNFSANIPLFAVGMKGASEVLGDNFDTSSMDALAKVGSALADLENSLPETDGKIQKWIGGKETMKQFTENFTYFIEGMMKLSQAAPSQDAKEMASTTQQYMDALRLDGNTIKPINVELIQDCATAGMAIAELEGSLTKTGSKFEWFTGKKDLTHFSGNLEGFAKGMVAFSAELQSTKPSDVANAAACVNNFDPKTMADTLNGNAVYTISNIDPALWTGFTATLTGYAGAIKAFTESMKNVDTLSLSAAASSMSSLINATKDIQGNDFGGLSTMTNQLTSISKGCIDAFIAEFDHSYSRTEEAVSNWHDDLVIYISNLTSSYVTMGKTLAQSVGKGIEEELKGIGDDKNPTNEFIVGMNAMTKEIESRYGSFYSCGFYIAEGFREGIKDNLNQVADVGMALVTTAEIATREAAKIASPSKVFKQDGKYIAEGFALGISNNTNLAKEAGSNLVETARDNIKSSISLLNSALNSDLNFDPTITPMVDLENVNSASKSISSMFNGGSLFGTNDINATIKQNQNRANPTLTAIESLKSELGKTGNTYNTINGITYDDGSNIHSAVGTLLHAAGVQRRK